MQIIVKPSAIGSRAERSNIISMTKTQKFLDTLLRSVLSGIMIGIGSIIYLSCDNKYIGAFLFGLGLFTILTFEFNLYTGKVGYATENKSTYWGYLLIMWIGNFIGTFLTGVVISATRVSPALTEKARAICEIKLNDNLISIFFLSLFCGMLMFIAADGYKNLTNPVAQITVVFLPVMVFILSGFEHCVANMAYFTIGQVWSLNTLIYLLIMTAGNSIGGMLIPWARKCFIKS